jgi:hypothetical protein
MHGVTTAIVAFLFAGVIWPHLVKHKVQFYSVLIIVVFIILLDGIGHGFASPEGGQRAIYAIVALLQVAGLVLGILSTGMSARDLGGEVFHTIDVVRRGGEKETIIVPLTGERPKPRGERDVPPVRIDLDRDIAAEEAALDAEEGSSAAGAPVPEPARAPAPAPPEPKKPADTTIPLE